MYNVVVVYPMTAVSGIEQVLLGRKLTGLGLGRWVGPGGKVEEGETLVEAAIRELEEEVGLIAHPDDLEPIARLDYPFPGRPHLSQRSHAYRLRRFSGAVRASEELSPKWWPLLELPLEDMWSDAKLWLPRALSGQYCQATITIGDRDDVLGVDWVEDS